MADEYAGSMEEKEAERREVAKYTDRFERLVASRSNWEGYWQECMDYIVPRKNDVTNKTSPGTERNLDLYDSTAIQANTLLAAALHGMLTNPATKFFDLIMGDPSLDAQGEVKEWLEDTSNRMFTVLNNSNFQTEIHEIYIDLGAIGTSCLYMGEHDTNYVHFGARPISEIYIDENSEGLVDTVYRKFTMKPRQIVQEWGEEKIPECVKKRIEGGSDDPFVVLHCVHPSDEKGGRYKYVSYYILKDESKFLDKSGFHEFPYAVPRWTKTSGESYGRGPGMDMLPDIRMVNKMMEITLKGAEKAVNPPLMVSDDGVIGRVRLTPGGLTVVRPGLDLPIRPLVPNTRIDFGYQAVEDVRKRIRSGFYVDQLQLNEGPQMTAQEVMQRTEEKLRLMGPVLGRQHFEFLRPVIDRVFGILVRRGKVSPPPPSIQGRDFDVRFSSLIARAQRASEGQNVTKAITVAAPIIQMDPKAADNIDVDQAMQHIFDVYGVPQRVMRKAGEVKKLRDERARVAMEAQAQEQQMQQAEMMNKAGAGVNSLAQAAAPRGV